MKVLHMISGGDSGGAKTHVFALLDALKKYCTVKIICFTKGVFYQEILKKDIDTILIEQKNRADLSIRNKIMKIIEGEKFDVLHIHGARANFVATLLKGKINIPIVSTVHSDYELDFTKGIYKKYLFTNINKIALKMVDYYIAVSENFKSMLIERGFLPNKIFTVYNGMDYSVDKEYISKEDFIKKYNISYSPENIYVGIIGRFDYVKGHSVFIDAAAEALKKNPHLRFLLAGEGPLEDELKKQAMKLGISDKVQFLGFIKDIYSFINFIDINTLTSLSESFPYVLLEGASMKKPTISSDVGGISDLITDGENGFLFDSKNYNELAEKILTMAENRELRSQMGEALYLKATTQFSSDNLAKRHMEIYNNAVSDYNDDKEYDVVMSGYYGFNNSGDEALLKAIIDNLRNIKKNIRVVALSKNAKQTKEKFKIDSVNRFNPFAINKVLNKTKLFINGGGTLIHDSTSSHSLYYYLYLMNWAKKKGLKVVMYGNGYGPFKPKNEKIACKITEKSDAITLRDELSYKELRRIGVRNENVYITADPAITLSPSSDYQIDKLYELYGLSKNEKYIAISVRYWWKNDKKIVDKLVEICNYSYNIHNLIPIFIVMRPDEDYAISEEIRSKIVCKSYLIKDESSAEDLMGIISRCEVVIGMRLHSLIYATSVCTPIIGIIYDPKIKGFLDYIEQKDMTDATAIDVSYVNNAINNSVINKEEIKIKLRKNLDVLTEKAMENAKITIDVLEEK